MANNISLTASMRSNLLSLQNISRQVSSTQNKLATGNKVNSAIDNPSSYYTARSLNNRANDLDALLDSMGQAVSTIKAATTALETGATFLEQAAAVATSALETNTIPAKSYFEEKVGENGAVVTTAQELKDAINSGKETICIYSQIETVDGSFTLSDNQKLVGINYFGNFDSDNKFSTIKSSFSGITAGNIFTVKGLDCEVANLRFEHDVSSSDYSSLFSIENSAYLHNIDVIMKTKGTSGMESPIECRGKNNKLLINQVNIFNNTEEYYAGGINVLNESTLIIDGSCSIVTSGKSKETPALINAHYGTKNNELIYITSNAKLFMSSDPDSYLISNNKVWDSDNQPNRVIIEKGAQIAVSDGNQIKYYLVKSDFESIAYDNSDVITFANIAEKLDVEEVAPWEITNLSKQTPQTSSSS